MQELLLEHRTQTQALIVLHTFLKKIDLSNRKNHQAAAKK